MYVYIYRERCNRDPLGSNDQFQLCFFLRFLGVLLVFQVPLVGPQYFKRQMMTPGGGEVGPKNVSSRFKGSTLWQFNIAMEIIVFTRCINLKWVMLKSYVKLPKSKYITTKSLRNSCFPTFFFGMSGPTKHPILPPKDVALQSDMLMPPPSARWHSSLAMKRPGDHTPQPSKTQSLW